MKKPTVPPAESNRSAFRRLRRSGFVASVLAVFAVCTWCAPRQAAAEVICVEDILPPGMAVTATGTATTCAGACRAREIRPVCGPIMKICAGQPIPPGYVLDSITTMPACQCLGSEDDAYVIRYVGTSERHGSPYESPLLGGTDESAPFGDTGERHGSPYGSPPFGNVLCATNSNGQAYGNFSPGPQPPQPYGNVSPWAGYNSYPPGSFPPGVPVLNGQGFAGGAPNPWAAPPPQQNEPFRVGQ